MGPHVDETAVAAGLADEVLELGYLVLAVAVEFAQLKAPETCHGCHVVIVGALDEVDLPWADAKYPADLHDVGYKGAA